jgi:hypothetical protein
MSTVDLNINKFGHGVRGYVTVDGVIVGTAQDMSVEDMGDDDIAYVAGSRSPQDIEIVNKAVRGKIKSLVLNNATGLKDLSTPISSLDGTVPVYTDNVSHGDYSNMDSKLGLMRNVEIVWRNKVAVDADGVITYIEFTAHNCVLKGKSYDFSKDSFWYTDVDFAGSHVTENYAAPTIPTV